VFTFAARMGTAKGTERFIKNLRDTLFAHTQYLPFFWHTSNRTGDIIQRCTYDVDTVQRFISQQLIEIVRTLILVTVALSFMFSMNVPLAVIALCFIPLVLGYSRFFFTRVADQFRRADEAEGALMIHVQENMTGVRVVRAFGRERHELERFDEKNEVYIGRWIISGQAFGLVLGYRRRRFIRRATCYDSGGGRPGRRGKNHPWGIPCVHQLHDDHGLAHPAVRAHPFGDEQDGSFASPHQGDPGRAG
jgi:ATP-binding cassette subfamily B protein